MYIFLRLVTFLFIQLMQAYLHAGADFFAGVKGDEYNLRKRSAMEILVKNACTEPLDYMPILKVSKHFI